MRHFSIGRFAATTWIFIAGFGLSGCATNPYQQFYKSFIGDQPPSSSPSYLPCDDEPKILGSDDFKRDVKELQRQGFRLVGEASFNAPAGQINETDAIARAKELGACRVLYTRSHAGSQIGGVPITYGSTAMMMPYSVQRDDADALFFVKQKAVFGVVLARVPAEVSQKIGKNGGALISAVMTGTPAYAADVLEGDILWTIDDVRIDEQNFSKIFEEKQGQSVKVELYRGDKVITKTILLNQLPQKGLPADKGKN